MKKKELDLLDAGSGCSKEWGQLFVLLVAFIPHSLFADIYYKNKSAVQSLHGIKSAAIEVTGVDTDAKIAGVNKDMLEVFLRNAIRSVGIKEVSFSDVEKVPGVPVINLRIQVVTSGGSNALCSFHYSVEVYQYVGLVRAKGQQVHAPTWRDSGNGFNNCYVANTNIYSYSQEMLNRFVEAYRTANPKLTQ